MKTIAFSAARCASPLLLAFFACSCSTPPSVREGGVVLSPEPDSAAAGDSFAAAVAEVSMLLRDSEWKGTSTYGSALDLLRGSAAVTGDAYKEEFLYLVTLLERQQ